MSRFATLIRQPRRRQSLAAEAAWRMALARASIRRHGQHGALAVVGNRGDVDSAAVDDGLKPLLRDLGWAIEATAKTLPWNTECLTQAIAAARMLSRRDIPWQIHVGLARADDEELIAHAWVSCGTRVLVGGAGVERFARLVTYASR
jgi:hypothetical protein